MVVSLVGPGAHAQGLRERAERYSPAVQRRPRKRGAAASGSGVEHGPACGWTIAWAVLIAALAGSEAWAAPRRLPDWSGVWENVSGIHFTAPVRDGKPLPANPPPLTPKYAARYKAVLDSAKSGMPINDPTANCVWPGMPRLMVAPYPIEFVITPKRVLTLHEYMSQVRRIRTDGSAHPADLEPSYNGDSTGHWEGQTLVVDTVGLRADTMYENTGLPHSEKLRVAERIHLAGPDELVDEMTFYDPEALTRPWTAEWHYRRRRDWRVLDYVCDENNRNPNIGGVTVVK